MNASLVRRLAFALLLVLTAVTHGQETPADTTPAAAEPTPAAADTTPAPTETTPAPADTTPAAEEPTPAPDEPTPVPKAPTRAEIETRLAALESNEELDEAAATSLKQTYEEILTQLDKAVEATKRRGEFQTAIDAAPGRLETISAELAQPPQDAVPTVPPEATLREIEKLATDARTALAEARKAGQALVAEAQRREDRRVEIRAQLQKLNATQDELQRTAAGLDPGAAEDAVAEANQLLLLARLPAVEAAVAVAEAELASYEAERDLLVARRAQATRRVGENEALADAWREIEQATREREAASVDRDVRELARSTAEQYPAFAPIAEDVVALVDERFGEQGTSSAINDVTVQLDVVRADQRTLRSSIRSMQRKIQAGGLTSGLGEVLRREYQTGPKPADLRRRAGRGSDRISNAQLRLLEIEERLQTEVDVERQLPGVLELLDEADRSAEAEQSARALLEQRRDLLTTLGQDYEVALDRYLSLRLVTDSYTELLTKYRSFIGWRILWVPSVTTGLVPRPRDMADALSWAFSVDGWREVGRIAIETAGDRWRTVVILLLLIMIPLAIRGVCRRRLALIAERVGRHDTDAFRYTFEALVWSLIMVMPRPLLVWAVGWWLSGPEQTDLGFAVGMMLRDLAPWVLLFELVARLVARSGLGESHFRWPARACAAVRFHARWLFGVMVVCIFASVFKRSGVPEWSDSLSRIGFIVATGAITAFVVLVLRKTAPLCVEFARTDRDNLMEQMRWLWFPVTVGVPGALSVLAAVGYYYTATWFARLILPTAMAILLMVFVLATLLRWLFVARRRLAYDQSQKRRETREAVAASEIESAEASAILAEEEIDIPALDAQTRRLFRAGMIVGLAVIVLWIWSGVLPALQVLDRVEVWPHPHVTSSREVDVLDDLLKTVGVLNTTDAAKEAPAEPPKAAPAKTPSVTPMSMTMPSAAPSEDAKPEKKSGWLSRDPSTITLGDVGLAIVLLVVTVLAFRNVPGLLEITLALRLTDVGLRFAIVTIAQYLIAILGAGATLSALGIGWSKVQWLAAALTFGLAFGLQEIFANFVSGLIILLERPVRVGDVVTVGGIAGRVTRIQMRATTITDWDRRELIVPNKEFVTGRIVNWTLSDPVTRVTVTIKVEHGSDVALVEKLLLEIAAETDHLVEDMPPSTLFRSLGENALEFRLMVFLTSRSFYFDVLNAIHRSIDQKFREAGITFAFPQRTVHMRS